MAKPILSVNEGSMEKDTLSVLSEVEENGVHVIHQDNQGVCIARNKGIELARGKYILTIDGDDKVSVRFIFDAVEILNEKPEYSVVYANGEYFGTKTVSWIIGEFNLQRLMLWNYIHISSVFRKSVWEEAKGYDPKANGLEDWDLWLSIAFNGGRFYFLNKSLFYYPILPNSANRSLTSERYSVLQAYINSKHGDFLGKEYLSKHFVMKFKHNKKLWLKLFLKIYIPYYLHNLFERGKVDNKDIN